MANDNKSLGVGGGEKARKEKERPCGDVSAMMACTLQLVL